MYRVLVSNSMETVFLNTVIAIRIYLSLMISNCSGERSLPTEINHESAPHMHETGATK